MIRKTFLISMTLIGFLSSCTSQIDKKTPLSNENDPSRLEVKLDDISADNYVSSILGGPSALKVLNLVDDITDIDFKGSLIASWPISNTFLDSNNHIRPDRVPVISAARVESMISPSPEELDQLALRYNANLSTAEFPYAREAFALNFTDKYVYEVDIPNVGAIAYIDASAKSINNIISNSITYADSPSVKVLEAPQSSSSLGFNQVQTIQLASLPRAFRKKDSDLSTSSTQKLYWFPADRTEQDFFHIVKHQEDNKFIDIKSNTTYRFHNAKSVESQNLKEKIQITFNNQLGYMEQSNEK